MECAGWAGPGFCHHKWGWRRRRLQGNLRDCVEAAGLEWQGRAHSGLDDARNTARLAAALLAGGAKLAATGAFDSCELGGLRQRKLFPDRCKPAQLSMATGGVKCCCAYICMHNNSSAMPCYAEDEPLKIGWWFTGLPRSTEPRMRLASGMACASVARVHGYAQ